MALLKKRYGAHLNAVARATIAEQRPYPSANVIRNPLTRAIARRVAEADWRATLAQIDFPYLSEAQTIGGVPCRILTAGAASQSAPVILYIHAGGFVSGSAEVNAAAVLPTCQLAGAIAISVDYSLAPEAVFPTQLIEIETVYRALLDSGRAPQEIVLLGDSAGGTLVASSLYRWRRTGLPMPAGAALLSPLLDAQSASDTLHTLRSSDPLFAMAGKESCEGCYRLYAGDASFDDPEVSPLAGDPAGMPPMLIHAGTREILLGDAVRFAEKCRRAGVDVSLRVFDGMFHLFHQHWSLSDAKAAHEDIAAFVTKAAAGARASAASPAKGLVRPHALTI